MAYKITDICVACGTCIDECPVGAISEGDIYKIDENACVSCGTNEKKAHARVGLFCKNI